MLYKLLLAFILIPLIELAILFKLAEWIGGWETFWLVILTGIAGTFFTRKEGLRTMQRIHYQLQAQSIPTVEITGGVLIFAAGLLLLTPGILTDIVGFAFLISPIRRRASIFIIHRLKHRFYVGFNHFDPRRRRNDSFKNASQKESYSDKGEDTIEVEARVINENSETDK